MEPAAASRLVRLSEDEVQALLGADLYAGINRPGPAVRLHGGTVTVTSIGPDPTLTVSQRGGK